MNFLKARNVECCKLLFWDKFLFAFIAYLTVLTYFTILGWLLVVTSVAKNFFSTFNLNFTIHLLNTPELQNSILFSGIFNLVAIIGFFALFCYIFDIFSKKGIRYEFEREDMKIVSPIFYCLIISAVLTGAIIVSYFEGVLGPFTISRDIEIITLSTSLILLLWSTTVLTKIYPKNHDEYTKILILLPKLLIFKKYPLFSIAIFLLILGIPVFGYVLGFNVLSILCLDLIMLFMVGILGTINNLPTGIANITLKNGSEISNVYILNRDQYFISYLSDDNKVRRITIDSIENYCEVKLETEFNILNPSFTIKNHQISQNQDLKIAQNCTSLSKINEYFIFLLCIVSLICGIFLQPIVTIYMQVGINWVSFIINCIFIFFFITFPNTILFWEFFKERSQN